MSVRLCFWPRAYNLAVEAALDSCFDKEALNDDYTYAMKSNNVDVIKVTRPTLQLKVQSGKFVWTISNASVSVHHHRTDENHVENNEKEISGSFEVSVDLVHPSSSRGWIYNANVDVVDLLFSFASNKSSVNRVSTKSGYNSSAVTTVTNVDNGGHNSGVIVKGVPYNGALSKEFRGVTINGVPYTGVSINGITIGGGGSVKVGSNAIINGVPYNSTDYPSAQQSDASKRSGSPPNAGPIQIHSRYTTPVTHSGINNSIRSIETTPVTHSGIKKSIRSIDYDASIRISGINQSLTSSGKDAVLVSDGNRQEVVSSGDVASITSSGNSGSVDSTGTDAYIIASGNKQSVSSRGKDAVIVASGNSPGITSSGDGASITFSGNSGSVDSTGADAYIVASGNNPSVTSRGKDAVIVASGNRPGVVSSGDVASITCSGIGGSVNSTGADANIKTNSSGVTIKSSGPNASIHSSGGEVVINSSGPKAQIHSSGSKVVITSSGANAEISASGVNATIKSTGTNASISNSGTNTRIQSSGSAINDDLGQTIIRRLRSAIVDSLNRCLPEIVEGHQWTIRDGYVQEGGDPPTLIMHGQEPHCQDYGRMITLLVSSDNIVDAFRSAFPNMPSCNLTQADLIGHDNGDNSLIDVSGKTPCLSDFFPDFSTNYPGASVQVNLRGSQAPTASFSDENLKLTFSGSGVLRALLPDGSIVDCLTTEVNMEINVLLELNPGHLKGTVTSTTPKSITVVETTLGSVNHEVLKNAFDHISTVFLSRKFNEICQRGIPLPRPLLPGFMEYENVVMSTAEDGSLRMDADIKFSA